MYAAAKAGWPFGGNEIGKNYWVRHCFRPPSLYRCFSMEGSQPRCSRLTQVLEVHYENVDLQNNLTDSTGFKVRNREMQLGGGY